MKFPTAQALLSILMITPAIADAPSESTREWNFDVSMDDKPIGTHHFTLTEDGGGRYLKSQAEYVVKVLGIPVYHYHHTAQEQWHDNCLTGLVADTNDGGTISRVVATQQTDGLQIAVQSKKNSKTDWKGCLMTYAYWNPEMRNQQHLLNPQTGEAEAVTITREQPVTVMVHGQSVIAQDWRIISKNGPVDVLYDQEGAWVGLDAHVNGDSHLAYRLP